MSYANSIEFASLMALIGFLAWLYSRRHKHKWKETSRVEVVRSKDNKVTGYRSYCVCDECGEPRCFGLY